MSGRGMTWTRQQKVGQGTAKALLLLLGVLCDDDDQVKRSQQFMADILECSTSGLKKSMKLLEEGGWVSREKRNGGSRSLSDIITLNIDTFVSHRQVDQGVDEAENPMGPDVSNGQNEPLHGTCGVPSMGPDVSLPMDTTGPSYIGNNLTTNLGTTTTTAADATADPRTAQDLVAEWIDHCDPKPPSRVIGQMSKEIKNLLGEGVPYEDVRTGLGQLHQRGMHPSTLPSFVHAARQRPGAGLPGTQAVSTGTQRAMEALQAGARLNQQHAEQQQAQLQIGELNDGPRTGQRSLGQGGTGGQPQGGRSGDPDVVGNPRPFEFR